MWPPIFCESVFFSIRAVFPSLTALARSAVSSPMRSTEASSASPALRLRRLRFTSSGSSETRRSSKTGMAASVATATGLALRRVLTSIRLVVRSSGPARTAAHGLNSSITTAHHGRAPGIDLERAPRPRRLFRKGDKYGLSSQSTERKKKQAGAPKHRQRLSN
jgi:hypothetical protein